MKINEDLEEIRKQFKEKSKGIRKQFKKEFAEAFEIASHLSREVFGKSLYATGEGFTMNSRDMEDVIDEIDRFLKLITHKNLPVLGNTVSAEDILIKMMLYEDDPVYPRQLRFHIETTPIFQVWYLEERKQYPSIQVNMGFLTTRDESVFFHIYASDDVHTGKYAGSESLVLDMPNRSNFYGKLSKDEHPFILEAVSILGQINSELQNFPLEFRIVNTEKSTRKQSAYWILVEHIYISKPVPIAPSFFDKEGSPVEGLKISAFLSFSIQHV